MKDIVIYGAGRYGNLAYQYYCNDCNILFFVDRNEKKWSKTLNGVEIRPVDCLRSGKYHVVIAVAQGFQQISDELLREYNPSSITRFEILNEQFLSGKSSDDFDLNCAYMMFSGGLGNQLFQYAALKAVALTGTSVAADMSLCGGTYGPDFIIEKVFKGIHLRHTKLSWKKLLQKSLDELRFDRSQRELWYSEDMRKGIEKQADKSILRMTGGVLNGLFQTHYFADRCRDELLKDLVFDYEDNSGLVNMCKKIVAGTYVSVHIRRGDYLNDRYRHAFEGICTDEYYQKAMEYVLARVPDARFCFFSDDIEYVQRIFNNDDHLFISEDQFTQYEDWYDMFLMSRCCHNIIANSTFSWWGAWLNPNPEKIVVAPSRWINTFEYTDIYPEGWITI